MCAYTCKRESKVIYLRKTKQYKNYRKTHLLHLPKLSILKRFILTDQAFITVYNETGFFLLI